MEREILFQPFSFFCVEKVDINLNEKTADIYLKTIGKKIILEKEIKKRKRNCIWSKRKYYENQGIKIYLTK